jgi:hypothetical protein
MKFPCLHSLKPACHRLHSHSACLRRLHVHTACAGCMYILPAQAAFTACLHTAQRLQYSQPAVVQAAACTYCLASRANQTPGPSTALRACCWPRHLVAGCVVHVCVRDCAVVFGVCVMEWLGHVASCCDGADGVCCNVMMSLSTCVLPNGLQLTPCHLMQLAGSWCQPLWAAACEMLRWSVLCVVL